MKRVYHIVLTILAAFPVTAAQAAPKESVELRKIVVLTVMAEAASANISLVSDRLAQDTGNQVLQNLTWNADYTDRDWVYRAYGRTGDKSFNITINGYLWSEEDNIRLTYAGTGQIGEETFRVNGQANWPFDKVRQDYGTMDFKQVAKFGQHSFWGWVLGAEVIVGGTIGASGAVAGSSVITAGAAFPAALAIGAAGGTAGIYACVGFSNAVKILLKADNPVPQPLAPPRPEMPNKGDVLSPSEGKIYTAVTDNTITSVGIDDLYFLTGQYNDKYHEAKGGISMMKR
jgi:hypothetical protein